MLPQEPPWAPPTESTDVFFQPFEYNIGLGIMQEFFLKMLDIFSKKLHSLANPPDETKSKKNPAANTAGHKTLFSIILML